MTPGFWRVHRVYPQPVWPAHAQGEAKGMNRNDPARRRVAATTGNLSPQGPATARDPTPFAL